MLSDSPICQRYGPVPTNPERVLRLAKEKGILRARDLNSLGIPRVTLTRLARAGMVERVGRGLYSLPGVDVSEFLELLANWGPCP